MKLEITGTGTGNGFGLRLIPETETEAELFRAVIKCLDVYLKYGATIQPAQEALAKAVQP